MPYGTANALKAILDAGPDIKVVHLNNGGGWIAEGEKIAQMIRARKITTYTTTECSSACTIAFLGGASRYLSSKGRLGFHSASFGSIDAKDVPEFNVDFRRALRENGVPSSFIDKAMRTASTSMWYPTHKELKTAGIITHSVDAESTASVKKHVDIGEIQLRVAQKINEKGPVDHSNGITTIGAHASGATLTYRNKIHMPVRDIPADWFPKFAEEVAKGGCKSLSSNMKYGGRYVYNYTDPDGRLVGTIPVNADTCKPKKKLAKDRARLPTPGLFDDIPYDTAAIGKDMQAVRNTSEMRRLHAITTKAAAAAQPMLPLKMGNGLRVEKVVGVGNKLTYFTRYSEGIEMPEGITLPLSSTEEQVMIRVHKGNLAKIYCAPGDTRTLLDRGVRLEYVMQLRDHSILYTVGLEKKDCT